MGKRNKIRYQSKHKDKVTIVLTGEIYLKYAEDDAIDAAKKGDMLVHPCNDSLNSTRVGDYYATGFSGYFKADVFEGNVWCPIILSEIFAGRENHFSKTECPIDTYGLCKGILETLRGRTLKRTYREHYELDEEPEASSSQA